LDPTLAHDGIRRMSLKEGTGRAKILVDGKGANLEMMPLGAALGPPVTVQLTNGTACWQALYADRIRRNDSSQFKAKAN
jgi:hypothetical protein